MPFEAVEEPVPSPDAFGSEGDAATLSAAAALLILGVRLRGDDQAMAARASEAYGERSVDVLPPEDVEPLQVPRLEPTGERVHPADAEARWREIAPYEDEPLPPSVIGAVADRFQAEPLHQTAAALFEACLRHPEELPRVAAASSYLDLTTDPRRPLDVLRHGLSSEDELTREVAATSLAHYFPEDPALGNLLVPGSLPAGGPPSRTCSLVHGTLASGQTWWQPGGTFHNYFLTNVRPDLYAAPDRFTWSGGYSDAARALGAIDLLGWVANHGLNGLDLVTHSHGGSVAMLATHGGLDLGKLVLLSCPVHIPKYEPHFPRIGKVVSIRVHMDLAILADRGGQRFNLPPIQEHVLPIWFKHSATHDPAVWRQHNVPQWL